MTEDEALFAELRRLRTESRRADKARSDLAAARRDVEGRRHALKVAEAAGQLQDSDRQRQEVRRLALLLEAAEARLAALGTPPRLDLQAAFAGVPLSSADLAYSAITGRDVAAAKRVIGIRGRELQHADGSVTHLDLDDNGASTRPSTPQREPTEQRARKDEERNGDQERTREGGPRAAADDRRPGRKQLRG